MARFELKKSIEAVKLNKRTMRAMGRERYPVPWGSIIENLTEDRDRRKFFYLGDPYECYDWELEDALREIK